MSNTNSEHNIVIVDDDNLMREIVADILLTENYSSKKFASCAEAEEYLSQHSASLLLLDVSMPQEDGYSFLARLKKNPDYKDLPVIFMTGKGDINDKIHGFELGAVDYIVKPFHRMDVLMRVKAHIRIVETHSENRQKLDQLEKAHKSFMPQAEDLPEAKFGIYFNSLLEAGGDFYDVIKLDEDRFVYFIADISGHDIATSYVMPAVKALMKQCFKEEGQLDEELTRFNQSVKDSIPAEKFITGLMILVNRKLNSVRIINMGHLPPVIIPQNEDAYLTDVQGDILGVHDKPHFDYLDLDLKKGDRIFTFTDGLLENPNERVVWTEGIKKLPAAMTALSENDLSKCCLQTAEKMSVTDQSEDDVLLMMIEV